ncbi:MAG: 3-oxoacid CoA-transferase subunit A [Dehalococcoidia bacterium]|nr:3-oxoacid CoA-transferase subunit A [Dehalococcoidia bacterium]
MPINKIVASFDEAVADIQDGATIMVGGFGTVASTASLLLEAVARKGVKNLTTISNTTGFGSDVWKLMGHKFAEDMDILVRNGHIKKAIASAPVSTIYQNNFEKLLRAGKVDLEMVPQGTLAERVRAGKAGLGGVYVPVGAGTVVEEGKETKIIDGKKYILELALKADFALIKAHKADRWGNLVYRGSSRTFNETMAGAANVTIAEVDEIVELGELDAEVIVTPGVYVDRVVVRPAEISEEEGEISAEARESHERFLKRGSA